jgi:hypothetical protein
MFSARKFDRKNMLKKEEKRMGWNMKSRLKCFSSESSPYN